MSAKNFATRGKWLSSTGRKEKNASLMYFQKTKGH
jgi:hypothetical protein